VVDVAHLVHGPIACEANSWDNRHSASSGSQLYRTGFTTDINELDVIYGGEKRLFKSIREIIEKYDPPAVFVYQTCVTALVGDDIEAVCQRATEKFGKPIIPVNAPGFAGPKNLGNKLGAEALLDALGIRILSCISGDGRYNEIASAHRAKVNMMVCSKSMINIASKMEQRRSIPYFEGSFYGIGDMSDTLRSCWSSKAHGAPDVAAPASDETLMAAPFVQQLVKQLRAQDIHGIWEGKSDLQLLKPCIHTTEERRALPIPGDPDPETLWHLEIFYNAIAVAVERETGQIEELPTHWEKILEIAQHCHEAHATLMEACKAAMAAAA
jgi:hypothetical protein